MPVSPTLPRGVAAVAGVAAAVAVLSGCGPRTAAPDASAVALQAPRHAAVRLVNVVRAGTRLPANDTLISPDGRSRASVTPDGRLVVRRHARRLWRSPAAGPGARLRLTRHGDLVLARHGRVAWATATGFPGRTRLVLGDDGKLVIRSRAGTVWSSAVPARCRQDPGARRRLDVDLSLQRAWLCDGTRQVLTSPITSGATALGRGTPTGTWRLQAKQRNRVLHPDGGGRFLVRYWLPYDGAYGLHDAHWQRFAYGSARYRRFGSHGCVHFPLPAMAFVYQWGRIGMPVTISQ